MAAVQPDVQGFLRAARQRLAAASLLATHDASFDSVYLAGYVAELALKAVILARQPRTAWAAVRDQYFAGSAGHSLDRLRLFLAECGQHLPPSVLRSLRVVSSNWTPQMRYQARSGDSAVAAHVSKAAASVLEWAERST